jgi:hypothetical protein
MSLWIYTISLVQGNATTALDIFSQDPSWKINRDSFVLANVCEYQTVQGDARPRPWHGDANIGIMSIIPQDNGHLIIQVKSEWRTALPLRIQIFIFD